MRVVPKSFECMSMIVEVLHSDFEDFGKYEGNKERIRISTKYSRQAQQQTFWHEWVHCALDQLGYDKLNDNEQFVDQMAHCLYQLEKTRSNK